MGDLVDPDTGLARSMTPNELDREAERREVKPLTEEELASARLRFSHQHFDGLWATLDARDARIKELEALVEKWVASSTSLLTETAGLRAEVEMLKGMR